MYIHDGIRMYGRVTMSRQLLKQTFCLNFIRGFGFATFVAIITMRLSGRPDYYYLPLADRLIDHSVLVE